MVRMDVVMGLRYVTPRQAMGLPDMGHPHPSMGDPAEDSRASLDTHLSRDETVRRRWAPISDYSSLVRLRERFWAASGRERGAFLKVTSRTWRGRWTFLLPSRRSLMVRSWSRG